MIVSSALWSFLRRASRWLAALAALATLGFAVAAALMFFWVLPNIAEHRDTVANLMSRALGQRVTLEAISGTWMQARPEFSLRGVRLYDQQGRPALYLPEIEATFAWRSLLFLEPRFNRIEMQGMVVGVRRERDGHFYVGGIPVNPAAPDSGFSNWLLRQGQVHVGGASLTWLDEMRNAPPLILQSVDFTLLNTRRTHRLQLRAVPPASLARPLAVDARLSGRDRNDIRTWSGTVNATLAGVSFPQLAQWLSLPYQPQQGAGALDVKIDVRRGMLAGVAAGIDAQAIEAALGDDLPPLRLARVRGQALWQRGPAGQLVAFQNLRVALPGGELGEPFDAGFAWNAETHEVTARALTLGGWQSILPSLPMDAAIRARLQTLQPQGRFDSLRLGWRGAQLGIDNFSIAARFRGLGIAAIENQPGLANLAGHVEGDARAGTFDVDTKRLILYLPGLFREPAFGFDSLQAHGSWAKTARGRRLTLDDATFANPDMAGSARGTYEAIPGRRGVIDLTGHLSRAEGSAVYRYLPKTVGDNTVNWVRQGVLAGHSDNVKLDLKGDLEHFPFDEGKGVFRVEAQVQDGVIDYVPGWPRIDGINGRLLFQGKTMTVTSNQARIYAVALAPVKVVIPDLTHHDEQLLINGQANGPAQDFIRFANSSPVAERLRGLTATLVGSGPMRLDLGLQVPLRHSDDTTVTGRLSLLGNSLSSRVSPRLDQVRGDIYFTAHDVTAKGLTAQLLGGPVRVDVATRDGKVQALAQGRVTAQAITGWLGPAWKGRFSGQTAWRGQIDLEPTGERILVDSDLVGLESALPAPLAKSATQALPLHVASRIQPDGQQHEVELDRTVGAVWQSAAGSLVRGEIRFGGGAALPSEPGLRLAGSGQGLDISGWAGLLRAGEGAALPVSTIDLRFDTFDLMGRRFEDVRLLGRNRNGVLRTQVSGHELSGTLSYSPAGEQAARLLAHFRQLNIPAEAPASGAVAGIDLKASDFPMLEATVDDFRLQDRPLGRLEVQAHGVEQGLQIDSLQLTHPDSVFRMSGLWRGGGLGETRADLSLKVLDAGRLLARFGFADMVRRGTVEIQGNATWEGSPADFRLATLAGQLDFKARAGQFLKVDPGVGKLLGVLSLQSLPRRLNFDFRDIFNEGFAFDDIGATLRIARGVVYSDDFKMRGPAAKVNMSGLADLNQETVQLRVKVIPKLSESVAVAGALLGGPLAGVGALAAQKLLRDPVEEAISQEYLVTGPWRAPDVKRLEKTKVKPEEQVPLP